MARISSVVAWFGCSGGVPQPGPVCLDPAPFRKHICVCVCEAYFYFAVENRIDASRRTSSASSRYVVLPRSVDQYIITVWSGVQAAGWAQNQSAGDSDTALTVPLSCMFPGHVHDITDHDIAVAEIKANARCRSVPAHGWRRKSLTIERRFVAVVVWMGGAEGNQGDDSTHSQLAACPLRSCLWPEKSQG